MYLGVSRPLLFPGADPDGCQPASGRITPARSGSSTAMSRTGRVSRTCACRAARPGGPCMGQNRTFCLRCTAHPARLRTAPIRSARSSSEALGTLRYDPWMQPPRAYPP